MSLSPVQSRNLPRDHTIQSPSHRDKTDNNGQRLDIFLFRTRFLKTRALSARIIRTGRVRLSRYGQTNRVLKPHAKVKKGDIITFMRNKSLINIEVTDLPRRRGPAAESQGCYKKIDQLSDIKEHK